MTEQNGKPVKTGMPAKPSRPSGNEKRPVPAKGAEPSHKAAPAPAKPRKPAVREDKEPVKKVEEPEKTEKTGNAEQAEKQNKPKISKFTKVLIIWLVALTIAIAGGLIWFNGFLGKYEKLYQDSLPYHQADNAIQLFANNDIDSLYALYKDKPQLSEFENDGSVKGFILNLIKGKEFTYKQTEDYAEDAPEYYIVAGNEIIAKLKLAEDETQNPPYGFKAWKSDKLEFYSAAQYDLKITIPESYKLTINGKDVPVAYKTQQGIELAENKYLKPYAELPAMCVYEAKGFYEEPVIKVTDADGAEVKPEKDKTTGEYSIKFRAEGADKEEVEKFAISFTKDFANYISQDAGNYALDKYFPSNSKTLRDIKRNSSREWYTRHGKVDIKNEQVKEFICYTKDIYYVEAYVEQHMEMFWGSKEREVVKTTARLYIVRIKGKWKIAGIRY